MREFRRSLVGFGANHVVVRAGSTKIECSDITIAKQIVDRFSSSSPSTTGRLEFKCQGNSWSVGTCGDGMEISVSVGQSKICACHGNNVVIRPCVNNHNWGGSGTKACSSPTTLLRMTVYKRTQRPTAQPTAQPTLLPTAMPTEAPTTQPTLPPTAMPTETPTTLPTTMPTKTPTTQPTMPTVHADLINDFDIIDKNGDGSLNYDEIVFAIADTNKDHKLSLKEYEAARADRLFIDTKYTLTNSTVVKISDDVDLSADFHTIDRNGDGFLNYDEIAFAIVDTKKNGKLSLEEYEAARADRIFVDTSYKPE